MRGIGYWIVLAACGLAIFTAVDAIAGTTRDAELVIQEGDAAPGTPGLLVTNLNSPFTNGNGQVGFTGGVDDGGSTDNFVWFDTGVIWRNSDALPTVLGGAEGTMGISDTAQFIYSPSSDGEDSVWTDQGLLLRETDPAPDFVGQFVSFASRPQMIDDGTAFWISGITDTMGGSTQFRTIYQSTSGVISKVIASGDMVGGFTIGTNGIDFDYAFSDDGSHQINVLLMETGSTTDDGFVYVDGALIARETEPTGEGDNWDNFDIVDINDSGDYIFTGDTDGATNADEFIAYNGSIAIRDGDTLDGVALVSASVSYASINNRGQATFIWNTGGEEYLFVGDADRLRETSRLILATTETVDFDGNGIADATITDFNASSGIGPGGELSSDNFLYIEVDLIPDGEIDEIEAILRLPIPAACTAGNVNELAAGTPENVLTIDGSDGGSTRTVTVSTGSLFEVSLAASTAGPATPKYAIWVWLGEGGNPATLSQGGSELGCATNPTPLSPSLSPQPRFCLISQGIPARACGTANIKNSPSLGPWSINASLANPIVLTFQGLVEDDSSSHPQGFSVSNAITLEIE